MGKNGREVETTIYSKNLNLDWNCTIYLPAGYDDEPSRAYPVIYMLHGAFGAPRNMLDYCDSPAMMERLAEEGRAEQHILVFVDGMNSYYIDSHLLKMESAIIDELIPWVNENFRVKPGRENCAVAGLSMGGHGAGRLALKHPEIFSAAVLMSPAVFDMPDPNGTIRGKWHVFGDGNVNFLEENWRKNHPLAFADIPEEKGLTVHLYISSGEEDEAVGISHVRSFAQRLDGFKCIDAQFHAVPGYGHSWAFWKITLEKGFEWLKTVREQQEVQHQ